MKVFGANPSTRALNDAPAESTELILQDMSEDVAARKLRRLATLRHRGGSADR